MADFLWYYNTVNDFQTISEKRGGEGWGVVPTFSFSPFALFSLSPLKPAAISP
jgi:hypothetical protein